MPVRDAAATRARILDAAVAEFAAAGLAGGRVERIAGAADANVRMIYAYFGGKTGLFDAALVAALGRMAAAVPPRPDDLAAWSGDVLDHHLADPAPLRLALWSQLERPEAAEEPMAEYLAKAAGVADDVEAGADLLLLLYGLAQAWVMAPAGMQRVGQREPTDPARIATHRARLVAAARAVVGAMRTEQP